MIPLYNEPYFPFLINKNYISYLLKIIHKINKYVFNDDYYQIVILLHELSRVASILSEMEIDLNSKRLQRRFDLKESINLIDEFIEKSSIICLNLGIRFDVNKNNYDKIKSASYSFCDNKIIYKVTFENNNKNIINLSDLSNKLEMANNCLFKSLYLLIKNWTELYKENENNDFSDYLLYVYFHSYHNSNKHFTMFHHFQIMNHLNFKDKTNQNAKEKYLAALKLFLDKYMNEKNSLNYHNLSLLSNPIFPNKLEADDLKVIKCFVSGISNSYYLENANYIFKENRELIMSRLYWEDKLSSSEKYGLYFLAVYFENLEIDSPLNKIIPSDIKYRLK